MIEALDAKQLGDGTIRVRCADGWLSMTSSDGRQILESVDMDDDSAAAAKAAAEAKTGAAGSSASDVDAAAEAAPTSDSVGVKLGKYRVKFKTVIRAGVAKDSDKVGLVKVCSAITMS